MKKQNKRNTYTPEEIEKIWKDSKPKNKHLEFDGSTYHKVIAFNESDKQQFVDSIELETDASDRWRLKHYQDRWMVKQDLQKFYELILDVIKKL